MRSSPRLVSDPSVPFFGSSSDSVPVQQEAVAPVPECMIGTRNKFAASMLCSGSSSGSALPAKVSRPVAGRKRQARAPEIIAVAPSSPLSSSLSGIVSGGSPALLLSSPIAVSCLTKKTMSPWSALLLPNVEGSSSSVGDRS